MKQPLARFESLVVQELPDELLICDTNSYRAFCLNKTAAEVWKLCDGKTSVQQISTALSGKFFQPVSEEVIWLALDRLSKDNLLENDSIADAPEKFNGLSRREVIRRIGMGSMIALPVVTSLLMPTAAQAQSGGIAPTSCLADSDCPTGGCCDTYNNVCAATGSFGCVCADSADCEVGLECCAPSNPVCSPGC